MDEFGEALAAWRKSIGSNSSQQRASLTRRDSRRGSIARRSTSMSAADRMFVLGYDFETAVYPRDHERSRLSKDTLETVAAIHKKHKWISYHIAVNMCMDIDCFERIDRILEIVSETQRDRFKRGHVGVKGATPTEKERLSLSNGWQEAKRRRTRGSSKSDATGCVLVADDIIERLRAEVRDLLDRKAQTEPTYEETESFSGRRNSLILSEESAFLINEVVLRREKLLEAIINSESFAYRGRVDLHALSAENSIRIVDKLVKYGTNFYVITGRGKHSKDNICVLSNEIQRYLKAKNIPFLVGDGRSIGRIFIESDRRDNR